jgi:hypothetical protein
MESVSIDQARYVAGFFDGDGTVVLYLAKNTPIPMPLVMMYQSHDSGQPPELLHIQKLYGGYICEMPKRRPNARNSGSSEFRRSMKFHGF